MDVTYKTIPDGEYEKAMGDFAKRLAAVPTEAITKVMAMLVTFKAAGGAHLALTSLLASDETIANMVVESALATLVTEIEFRQRKKEKKNVPA